MKKFFIPVTVLLALLIIGGCSQKFNIGAPYKNITVVYGFLDEADTAHYIRIEKAFLDQNKSSLVMAQVADSSFYSNINVKIKRINAVTDSLHDTIHLYRVDLNLEGYPKQPGVFFDAPNYAYKFTNLLDPAYNYRLVITNLTTGEVDSAETPIIDDLNLNPNKLVFYINNFDDIKINLDGIDFYATGVNSSSFSIYGAYGSANPNQPNPVGIVDAVVQFNWHDSNTVTHVITNPAPYNYDLGYTTLNMQGAINYDPLDNDLYDALYAGMGIAPANTVRLLDRCNVFVYLSTNDFSTYEQAEATQGTGLTGSEIEPAYTNVKGANVLGLYTARGVRSGKMTIDAQTVDSLIVSPFMAQARIVGTIYH